MTTTSISTVFSELFEAPLRAATEAEARYRAVWADWISSQFRLFSASGTAITADVIAKVIDLAPVVKLDGFIDVAITMRIAEVKEKEAGFSGGLQLGIIQSAGKYSSYEKSAQESVFQASTRFSISNTDANLRQFLTDRGLVPTNAQELNRVVNILNTATPISPPNNP